MLFKGSDVVFERVVVNESKIGLFIKAINQTFASLTHPFRVENRSYNGSLTNKLL